MTKKSTSWNQACWGHPQLKVKEKNLSVWRGGKGLVYLVEQKGQVCRGRWWGFSFQGTRGNFWVCQLWENLCLLLCIQNTDMVRERNKDYAGVGWGEELSLSGALRKRKKKERCIRKLFAALCSALIYFFIYLKSLFIKMCFLSPGPQHPSPPPPSSCLS